MTHAEMNFERCQALDKARELRKQNAELRKELKYIRNKCKEDIQLHLIAMRVRSKEGSFTLANVTLKDFIKRINKVLK